MYNLHILFDIVNNGYFLATLDILTYFSIISAVTVITIKNPIISVLFLIMLFLLVSSYLICSGAVFIGLAYLLVYIGAVSILFLFILMLINIRVSELITETKNSIPLVIIVAIIFKFADNTQLFSNTLQGNNFFFTKTDCFKIVSHLNWEDSLTVSGHIASIGYIIYSVFAILLLMVSIILLLAMIGAIAITIKPGSTTSIVKSHPVQSNIYKNFYYNKKKILVIEVLTLYRPAKL